jgi:hypothetical protein
MPIGRRPPLSQKSLDFMRSQFEPPTQPPERPTMRQRISSIFEWTMGIGRGGVSLPNICYDALWSD